MFLVNLYNFLAVRTEFYFYQLSNQLSTYLHTLFTPWTTSSFADFTWWVYEQRSRSFVWKIVY